MHPATRTRSPCAIALACLLALAAALALAACVRSPSTTGPAGGLRPLTDAETERLWAGPTAPVPVGPATVQRIPVAGGVAVACSQTYAARLSTGRPGGAVTVCGGSCKLKPGATLSQCQTSGCLPSGRSCTPLVCSGGCELSQACSAEKSRGFALL